MGLFRRRTKAKEEKRQPSGEQEAVVTLYACRKGTKDVPEAAKRWFADVMEQIFFTDEDEFCLTLRDGTGIQFHIQADPKETAVQAKGMAAFFSRAPLKNEAVKQAAVAQILLFNCIIGVGFTTNENAARTDHILHKIHQMAEELCAFVLYPNMYLYHADGRLLLSIDGKSDFEEYRPQASSSILEREREEEEADRARKERSLKVLRAKKIPYMEHLKVSVFESECRIPSQAEIVRRLACVFAACVCSEVYTCGRFEDPQKTAEDQIRQMEERYQIFGWLSPEERAYLSHPAADPTLHNRFGWRYECCAVFLWALNLLELKEPDEICDAAELGGIMWSHTFDSLMEAASLRSREEILDLQDLVLRYDWACVDARIHHREVEGLNGEIVYEQHYALNWLVGADGIEEWDRIVTTT